MKPTKKLLLIGTLCVVVLAGTLGGFAIASADDEDTTNATQVTQTDLMEKVAEIYEQNTGTAIDPTELQNAFAEAGAVIRDERQDQFFQNLVDEGIINQEQADEWKAWLDARPDNALTDEFRTWMESRPDIPGLFGTGNFEGRMPFGMHRGPGNGKAFGFGFRNCLPGLAD